ncbi:hypothetical protein N0V86_002377 [Didymella sp. IMI 355093]|nr:hypothetical protein N0V86_002377 [Didymella sp. IMI 355093]
MPPLRLPRHLRPCRPLWSARQVRFASDKPSDARLTGGDSSKSAQETEGSSQTEANGSRLRLRRHWSTRKQSTQPSAARIYLVKGRKQERLQQAQHSATSTQADVSLTKATPEPPTEGVTQLKISKVHRPAPTGKKGIITAHLKEKEKLLQQQQQQQQAGTSTQNDDELRERLKKLEAQLAVLQAKLATDNAVAAESNVPSTAVNTETAEAKASDSTTDSASAERSGSTTSDKKPVESRKTNGNSPDKKSVRSRKKRAETQPPVDAGNDGKETAEIPPPSQSTPQAPTASGEVGERSLLDELFPEASSLVQPDVRDKRPSPPKLDLPATDTNPHIRLTLSDTRTPRERAIDSFRARGEQTTVLQLSNCSTALADSDFRRLMPRGAHIDTWSSAGEFYKIIPGRDPLSLARLPFYYLLFHSAAAALAYQKNAARLSKLAALHASSSIASAVAPPAGFLENGEDVAAVTSSFVLHPQGHALDLRTVMQPYNRALRALIDAGGYTPIAPNVDEKGQKIHRVLLTIDGYEPSHWDLWQIISRHAHARGILWPFRNDHASALRRLRDAINLKTVGKQKFQDLSTTNPRAAPSSTSPPSLNTTPTVDDAVEYEDPTIAAFLGPSSPSSSSTTEAKEINQLVMNRVYNRWIVEFDDEDAAKRFASLWHRVVLPDAKERDGKWKEAEEERWVEAEYLW